MEVCPIDSLPCFEPDMPCEYANIKTRDSHDDNVFPPITIVIPTPPPVPIPVITGTTRTPDGPPTTTGPLRLICPGNVMQFIFNPTGAQVFFSVQVVGGTQPYIIQSSFPSGFTFPVGTTTVLVQVGDARGNVVTCSFQITLILLNLAIKCPSNITVHTLDLTGAVVNYSFSVTGGCGTTTKQSNPPSGTKFAVGTTSVVCRAFDTCGEDVNCGFTVQVILDRCPPVSVFPQIAVSNTDNSGGVWHKATRRIWLSGTNKTSIVSTITNAEVAVIDQSVPPALSNAYWCYDAFHDLMFAIDQVGRISGWKPSDFSNAVVRFHANTSAGPNTGPGSPPYWGIACDPANGDLYYNAFIGLADIRPVVISGADYSLKKDRSSNPINDVVNPGCSFNPLNSEMLLPGAGAGVNAISYWRYTVFNDFVVSGITQGAMGSPPWYIPELQILLCGTNTGWWIVNANTHAVITQVAGAFAGGTIWGAVYDSCNGFLYATNMVRIVKMDTTAANYSSTLVANDNNSGGWFDDLSNYVYAYSPNAPGGMGLITY